MHHCSFNQLTTTTTTTTTASTKVIIQFFTIFPYFSISISLSLCNNLISPRCCLARQRLPALVSWPSRFRGNGSPVSRHSTPCRVRRQPLGHRPRLTTSPRTKLVQKQVMYPSRRDRRRNEQSNLGHSKRHRGGSKGREWERRVVGHAQVGPYPQLTCSLTLL